MMLRATWSAAARGRMIERGLEAEGRTLDAVEVDRLVERLHRPLRRPHRRSVAAIPGPRDRRSTRSRRAAAGWRSAPTSSNGCRCGCSTRSALSKRFAAICGGDTFGLQKPDPELLRRTIARAGGDAGATVMVGDSVTDIAIARAAGVPVVAVDYGYTETPVAELGADRVISALSALPERRFRPAARPPAGAGGAAIIGISPYRRHT